MGLSRYERTVLRRLGADLGRQDPRLGRLLTDFRLPGLETPGLDASGPSPRATWRPPRAAVALAAVMLAGATFMLVGLTLVMRQPCPAAETRTTTQITGSSRPSGPSPAGPPGRGPGSAGPSAPSTC